MAALAPSSWAVDQEEIANGKHFKNQLAAMVRRMDWTYAIFWSCSNNRPGVLTWKEGRYNGSVKTRKVVSSGTTDEASYGQRSDQLRELYVSLVAGAVSDQRTKRPAPAPSLSLDDLADNEWYYMVSMSYAFLPDQGLPGKCFASNEHVWLCDAQAEDAGRAFARMPLAKTVVGIPFMDGVLELGTTDLLLEDPELVTRTVASFWELQPPAHSEENVDNLFESIIKTQIQPHEHHRYGFYHDTTTALPATPASLLQQIDQAAAAAGNDGVDMDDELIELDSFFQEAGSTWIEGYFEASTGDVVGAPSFTANSGGGGDCQRLSSFTAWERSQLSGGAYVTPLLAVEQCSSQRILKKIAASAWVEDGGGGTPGPEGNGINSHARSERRRRERLKDMFLALKSLVPSAHKLDKASILAETIVHVRELKRRVQELESSRPSVDQELFAAPAIEARRPRRSDMASSRIDGLAGY